MNLQQKLAHRLTGVLGRSILRRKHQNTAAQRVESSGQESGACSAVACRGFDVVVVVVVECGFTSTETVGLLGTGAQDGHPDFHTAPELCSDVLDESCT